MLPKSRDQMSWRILCDKLLAIFYEVNIFNFLKIINFKKCFLQQKKKLVQNLDQGRQPPARGVVNIFPKTRFKMLK